jgi:hypothetical protein
LKPAKKALKVQRQLPQLLLLLPSNFMNHATRSALWIVLIAALTFIPFLGFRQLFDWDEVNFAESAREMVVFRKKPPTNPKSSDL